MPGLMQGTIRHHVSDVRNARPAAIRANALKDRYRFKTDMDDDARKHLFRHATSS